MDSHYDADQRPVAARKTRERLLISHRHVVAQPGDDVDLKLDKADQTRRHVDVIPTPTGTGQTVLGGGLATSGIKVRA